LRCQRDRRATFFTQGGQWRSKKSAPILMIALFSFFSFFLLDNSVRWGAK
jgi:hypothetical protein